MDYRKRLLDLRTDKDLKQEDVAKILNTTKQSYSNYERGYRKLNIDDLMKLADFYNVSTDYILGRTDNPELNKPTNNINWVFNLQTIAEHEFIPKLTIANASRTKFIIK